MKPVRTLVVVILGALLLPLLVVLPGEAAGRSAAAPTGQVRYPVDTWDIPNGESAAERVKPSIRSTFGGSSSGNTTLNWQARPRAGSYGGSLKVTYDTAASPWGAWYTESLFGVEERFAVNADDFFTEALQDEPVTLETLEVKLRGSGASDVTHGLRVMIGTDGRDRAYHDFTLADRDTDWTTLRLPLDFSDTSFWTIQGSGPDRKRLKTMELITTEAMSPHKTGSYYVDDLTLIDEDGHPFDEATATDEEFLLHIAKREFQFLLDWYYKEFGYYTQSNGWQNRISTDATGFYGALLPVGVRRGWITKEFARQRAKETLDALLDGQDATKTYDEMKAAGPLPATNGYKGFYTHSFNPNDREFSDMTTGSTAYINLGIIKMREFFKDDAEITTRVDRVLDRTDWDFALLPNGRTTWDWSPNCNPDTLPAPGGGCINSRDNGGASDEDLVIPIVGMSSRTHPLDVSNFYYRQNIRRYGPFQAATSWFGSAFTYEYIRGMVDFKALGLDDNPDPAARINWFENSQNTMRAMHLFTQDQVRQHPGKYPAYENGVFGLTADPAPGLRVCGTYCNYGGGLLGARGDNAQDPDHDGTISPFAVLGTVHMTPEIAIPAAREMFRVPGVWNERMGFVRDYNLRPDQREDQPVKDPDTGLMRQPSSGTGSEPWLNPSRSGDNRGAAILSIDAYLGGKFDAMENKDLRKGLCKVFSTSDYCKDKADVSVRMTSDKATATVGDTVTLTVTARNNGPDPATAVTVDVEVGPGLELTGEVQPRTLSAGNAHHWAVGDLAVGAEKALELKAKITAAGDPEAKATIKGAEEDPQPGSDTTVLKIAAAPQKAAVAVTMAADKSKAAVGEEITFTVTVKNNGPGPASAAAAYLTAGPELQLPGGSPHRLDVGPLAVGESRTVTFKATVKSPGTPTLTATVTGPEVDPARTGVGNVATVRVTTEPAVVVPPNPSPDPSPSTSKSPAPSASASRSPAPSPSSSAGASESPSKPPSASPSRSTQPQTGGPVPTGPGPQTRPATAHPPQGKDSPSPTPSRPQRRLSASGVGDAGAVLSVLAATLVLTGTGLALYGRRRRDV